MGDLVIQCFYVFAGICVYGGIFHLAAGLRRPIDHSQLLFSVMCFLAIPFAIFHTLVLRATDLNGFAWALRWSLFFGVLMFAVFPWFIRSYTGKDQRQLPATLSLLMVAISMVNLAVPFSIQYDSIADIAPLHLPWHEVVTRADGHNGLWAYVTIMAIAATFAYVLFTLVQVYFRFHRTADRIMMLAVVLFLLGTAQGILVRLSIADLTEAGLFTFAAMLVAMGIGVNYRSQQRLRNSERYFRLLFDNSPTGILAIASGSGRIIEANRSGSRMLGYSPGEILGVNLVDLVLEDVDDMGRHHELLAGGETERIRYEGRFKRKDGTLLLTDTSISVIKDADSSDARFIANMIDVTDRKRAEHTERRHVRAIDLLSKCDSLVVRSSDEKELLGEICTLAVEVGGYLMAWVGFAGQDDAKTVYPVARSGYEEGYLEKVTITWGDGISGKGPAGTAIKTGRTVVVQDFHSNPSMAPWRDAAKERGYHSLIALPLTVQDHVIGAFLIYSTEPYAFDDDEVKLLENLASDLAYGIHTLRVRAERVAVMRALKREGEKYLALIRNASDGIHVLDSDGNVVEASDSFCAMLGYERDEVLGKHVSLWDAKTSREDISERLCRKLRESGRSQFHTLHRRKDGATFDAEVSVASFELENERFLFCSSRDITERKQFEAALSESEARFRSIIEQSPLAISFSKDGFTVDVNAAFLDMFGYEDSAELEGTSVLERIAPRARMEIEARIRRRMEGKPTESTYETIGLRKDGSEFPLFVSARRMMLREGAISTAFLIDFSERKKAEERIEHLAFYDQLTDLPNRWLLAERLDRALISSEQSGRHGALLLVGLDNFKTINETLGHDVGDLLLKETGQRLRACVGEGDTVARFGGDEFMVMALNLSEDAHEAAGQVEAIGERISLRLNELYLLADNDVHGSCSVGAAMFGRDSQTIDELLKQVDIAMRHAKDMGHGTLQFFDPQMQDAISARAILEAELHKALEKRQLSLHFQVQMDHDRRPIGAEALLRWIHPELGMVSPARFIPLAEETGQILSIGRWVLESACAQLKVWREQARLKKLTLAVNVSARQFHQADFVAQIDEVVQLHKVDPSLLKLELTEGMLIEDVEDTVAKMKALKDIGVELSLDDFGTGYSSLTYLKLLPLDQIKVDQSFVRDIAVNSSDRAIVRTIIGVAQSLDLDVIAEGVETEEQWRFLKESGCRHYQGYMFGKPVDIDTFNAQLLKM